jgi:hypothetical protein
VKSWRSLPGLSKWPPASFADIVFEPPAAAGTGPAVAGRHLEYLEWAAAEVMPIFRPSL